MNTHKSFFNSVCEEQARLAERELAAFVCAVTELFGPGQATLSQQDWLDESEFMDSPPASTGRNWRAVTIAASARLANRMSVGLNQQTSAESNNTKASPIPSSNCSPGSGVIILRANRSQLTQRVFLKENAIH